jgi:hypothetical protein
MNLSAGESFVTPCGIWNPRARGWGLTSSWCSPPTSRGTTGLRGYSPVRYIDSRRPPRGTKPRHTSEDTNDRLS